MITNGWFPVHPNDLACQLWQPIPFYRRYIMQFFHNFVQPLQVS